MKKLFFRLLLILSVILFSISLSYSTGTTYCANLDSNGKLPANAVGKKFNPGHYVSTAEGMRKQEHDKRMTRINKYVDDPEITGIEVYFEWSELEPTQGNYQFQKIQEILDLFEQHDKHLIIYIIDRSFWDGGCVGGIDMVPQYLRDQGGAYKDDRGACMPRMYESWFVDHYIRFVNAIGNEFNDHPNFEMLLLPETALARPEGEPVYNQIEYGKQLERFFDETTEAYKNTLIGMQVNWLHEGRDQTMDDLFAAIVRNNGALSWPDPFPGRDKERLLRPHQFAKNNKNLIAVTPHVDTTFLYFDDTQEVFDRYVDELEVSHVLWHEMYTGRPDGGWKAFYYEEQIIPTIRNNNGRTNTNCPSNYGTCLDTSQSCDGNSNPPTGGSSDCGRINPGDSISQGYGAPYDHDNNRKVIKATCNENNNNVNTEIGYSGSNYYIYRYGYVWENNAWQQVDLQGTKVSGSNDWIRDRATAQISIDPSNDNYFLGYVCKWTGSKWKCGCNNQACTTSFWNLQIIKK